MHVYFTDSLDIFLTWVRNRQKSSDGLDSSPKLESDSTDCSN